MRENLIPPSLECSGVDVHFGGMDSDINKVASKKYTVLASGSNAT